mmetsp:Transcript_19688/g.64819  ORF Transcript_19688/g.64819 Transcript_19688/m.64819 type:complete len:497 (-) Transcript_19688:590-2080(-)
MALSAEEVNYLVYRYLQESGHLHSAFTFAYESLVTKSTIAADHADDVPPGALISFIQKGLMYLQVEQQMECIVNGSTQQDHCNLGLLQPQILRSMSRSQTVKYAKWTVKYDKNRDEEEEHEEDKLDAKRKRTNPELSKEMSPNSTRRNQTTPISESLAASSCGQAVDNESSNTEYSPNLVEQTERAKRSSNLTAPLQTSAEAIWGEDIVVLAGHEAEVFCCSWHPQDDLLASGSGDSTVRLWSIQGDTSAAQLAKMPPQSKVLEYVAPTATSNSSSFEEDHDVTTLEWSADGSLLATGCMDGIARLWSRDGNLRHSLAAHSESIFSLRFDAMGKRLLTGSYDKCVSVWDVQTGVLRHKFEAHSAQVLDVDWKHGGHHGRDVFASCSTDRTIAVCALSDLGVDHEPAKATTTPLQVLVGHADEVNAIRWDPSGSLLASCSDDHNVFVWQLGQSRPVYRFSDHVEEIYTIRWSPMGASDSNVFDYSHSFRGLGVYHCT